MELNEIKIAMAQNKTLYINNREIKVIYLELLTKTIKVLFLESNNTTFVTKSCIKPKKKENYNYIRNGILLFEI